MPHIERALFVIGEQGDGKSTQLRSMFRDFRFNTWGHIPSSPKIHSIYALSNERRLYLRLTSPHERDETQTKFHDKFKRILRLGHRWNFACPIQPDAFNQMPDAVETIIHFAGEFSPERVRAVFLSPNRKGLSKDPIKLKKMHDLLWKKKVECISIDARTPDLNGKVLSDFFDFT
ncbi:hypothetical protein ACQKGO_35785 [Corallococcus interemptor]|uniref:hypothetical protein n=1 Tax=Corallococcus interemptor TaxID=2316720 RepID=UPI003D01B5C2